MKTQQDMFDQFREKASLLEERPSPQVWRRLERRLDTQPRRHHLNSLQRGMAMAMGLIVLAVVVGIGSLTLSRQHRSQDAFYVETISTTDIDPEAIQAVEVSRHLRQAPANINEGLPGKALIVKGKEL